MRFKPAERAASIQYAIRDVVVRAKEIERQGNEIIKLNIGDPDAYDFDTPEHIKRALFDAVLEGYNGYCDSEGDPDLREAIAERERRKNHTSTTAQDVIVTAGITEGIQMLLAAMISEGDELLVPGPTYPQYLSVTKFFGGTPVPYRTVEQEGWRPDLDDLRKKVGPKTRGILVVSPNNPTGAVYRRRDLEEICNIASAAHVPVVSDEIYDMLIYEGEHLSPVSVSTDTPVITVNGFSKAYLVTGWRAGYIAIRDCDDFLSDFREALLKEARARLSANYPVQRAMIAALKGPQDHVRKVVRTLRERRDYLWKRFNEIDGISSTRPEGAFYLFPRIESSKFSNDMEFVDLMLREAHVLLVNGSGFDPVYGSMHFRSVFLAPVEMLERAADSIADVMRRVN